MIRLVVMGMTRLVVVGMALSVVGTLLGLEVLRGPGILKNPNKKHFGTI